MIELPRSLGMAASAAVVTSGWLLASIAMVSTSTAHAYRTFADDPEVGRAAHWPESSMEWEVYVPPAAADRMPSAELAEVTSRAAMAVAAADCSPPYVLASTTRTGGASPGDGRNTIEIVVEDWVGRGFPSGQGATTDVQLEISEDGTAEIVEADMYLNFAGYEFVTSGAHGDVLDLQSVVTHELLHGLGLLHVCEEGGELNAPICAPEHRTSAVYPVYVGEAARTLARDDLEGLCFLYPTPCPLSCPAGSVCSDGACTPPQPGACSENDDCTAGKVCGQAGPKRGICVGAGQSGAPCTMGEECDSLLCVSGHGRSYCTVSCEFDDQCEGLQRCAVVAGRSVCAPLGETGCSVAHPQRSAERWRWPWLALGALLLSGLIRRGRRRSS